MKPCALKKTKILQFTLLIFFLMSFCQAVCQEKRSVIPSNASPRLIFDGSSGEPGLIFTEGPSWMNGKLYFSNIYFRGKRGVQGLHVLNPDGTMEILNSEIQSEGASPLPNGNFAVCDMRNLRIIEMTPRGKVIRTIADSCNGKPIGMPNDLITDTKGGIYFTQPDARKLPGNAVYYVNPAGKVIRVTDWNEFDTPNGCVMSPDGSKFYLGDFPNTTVWVFDVNADGTLYNKKPFADVMLGDSSQDNDTEKAYAGVDGLTIDREGNLYATSMIGIHVFDKTGDFIDLIEFPKRTVHCVFGGEDLSVLYALCMDQIYTIQTNVKGFQYPIGE